MRFLPDRIAGLEHLRSKSSRSYVSQCCFRDGSVIHKSHVAGQLAQACDAFLPIVL